MTKRLSVPTTPPSRAAQARIKSIQAWARNPDDGDYTQRLIDLLHIINEATDMVPAAIHLARTRSGASVRGLHAVAGIAKSFIQQQGDIGAEQIGAERARARAREAKDDDA